jgi:hypothetical protein
MVCRSVYVLIAISSWGSTDRTPIVMIVGGGIIDMMNTRLQHRMTEQEILKIFSDTVEVRLFHQMYIVSALLMAIFLLGGSVHALSITSINSSRFESASIGLFALTDLGHANNSDFIAGWEHPIITHAVNFSSRLSNLQVVWFWFNYNSINSDSYRCQWDSSIRGWDQLDNNITVSSSWADGCMESERIRREDWCDIFSHRLKLIEADCYSRW